MSVPTGHRERALLMDAARLKRTLARLAAEIAERLPDAGAAVLLGVRTRGVPLARRLAAQLERAVGRAPAVGALDITLYRDDLTTLGAQPLVRGTDFPVPLDGRSVVLVDDVLFTGRTVRAALDELTDFGRPARIQLAVLIDRGHRELPIQADYVGRKVPTARDEVVQVRLSEEDGEDRVVLLAPARAARPAPPRPRRARPARAKGRS
jgi:pyrimidine operon attenuation protein/uracil phosphoribosyltransferase